MCIYAAKNVMIHSSGFQVTYGCETFHTRDYRLRFPSYFDLRSYMAEGNYTAKKVRTKDTSKPKSCGSGLFTKKGGCVFHYN